MKKFILSAVLFVFTAYAGAADFVLPKQRIVGAEEPIPLGELVMLSVSKVDEKPKYLEQMKYTWKIFENGKERTTGVRFYEDNIFFGSGIKPKKMVALVSASYLYVVREGDKTDGAIKEFALRQNFLSVEVIIGDGPPGPDPPSPPNPPNPPDDPIFPNGEFGLAKLSYSWAKNVNTPNKAELCWKIADSFTSIASRIDKGELTDLKQALDETQKLNKQILGTSTAFTGFGNELQKFLYENYKNGKLRTAKQLYNAWNEVALGLKSVKKTSFGTADDWLK